MKIDKKIISYKVLTKDKEEVIKNSDEILPTDKITQILPNEPIVTKSINSMGEHIERLDVLSGRTYKLKPSNSEHAYYITVNNILVEDKLYPYEIFINSKGIEHYKLLGFARLISAIFRKGGDIIFLIEELRQIYDPVGAYTSKRTYENGKRKRFNSLEAEIGDIIEEHLVCLTEFNSWSVGDSVEIILDTPSDISTEYPSSATLCSKCYMQAVVRMDGCDTCLACGDSKCG